jgi:hypothetical protein
VLAQGVRGVLAQGYSGVLADGEVFLYLACWRKVYLACWRTRSVAHAGHHAPTPDKNTEPTAHAESHAPTPDIMRPRPTSCAHVKARFSVLPSTTPAQAASIPNELTRLALHRSRQSSRNCRARAVRALPRARPCRAPCARHGLNLYRGIPLDKFHKKKTC